MDEGQWEFDYREPWLRIAAVALGGAIGVGPGVYRLLMGYAFAPPAAGRISAVALILLGLMLWALAGRMALNRWRRPRVRLNSTQLELPRRLLARTMLVPLTSISGAKTECRLGRRQLHLIWPEGRITIDSAMLAGPHEFKRFADRLTRTLANVGVPVEGGASPAKSRRRPQFTLGWAMLVMTLVAAVLGMHSYVYGNLTSDVLVELGMTLAFVVFGPWLALAAPRSALVFAIGFVLGFWLEWLMMLAGYWLGWTGLSPSGDPPGWYPFTSLVWRTAAAVPGAGELVDGAGAYVIGGAVSGVLAGTALLAISTLFQQQRVESTHALSRF